MPCSGGSIRAVIGRQALVTDRTDLNAPGTSRADRAMDRYAGGEEAAFVELYEELAPRLHRFALRWTHSGSTADDVVQQTLLQMHGARHRFVRGAAVVPWAYAIARRILVDLTRRGAREELRPDDARGEEPAPTASPEEALHGRRLEAEARRDLALLPTGWRESFELVRFEGLSVAEAAEALGITQGMVKIRTHRASAALRKAMARRLRADESPARPPLPETAPGRGGGGGVST